jgi:hypothetical protein
MTFQNYTSTAHFMKRIRDRTLPAHGVDLVLRIGKRIYNRGALFQILTDRICDSDKLPKSYRGITLVLDVRTNTLITVYRHHGKSLAHFKKGVKYDYSLSSSRRLRGRVQ